MTEGLFPLTVAGDRFYNAYISLEPGPHMRFPRFDRDERIQGAATLKGAELEGGLRDGRSIFELNSYTLEDVIESDGDRCLLASLKFLSVTMSSEKGGRLYLKGLLSGAETYSQDVHDRIAAGTALEEIPEMAGDFGGIRYLPPRHAPLQEYFCWEATIRLVPRNS